MISLSLAAQVVVWSLATFTELRYDSSKATGNASLVVNSKEKPKKSRRSRTSRNKRWAQEETQQATAPRRPLGQIDVVFKTVVEIARPAGLVAALLVCPLVGLAVMLAIPAGAPRVEAGVTALVLSMILTIFALPLGGWFGMAWGEGTFTSYDTMIERVELALEEGFELAFWSRFLLLPTISVVGFFIAALKLSAAVEAVLIKTPYLDPELEAEAANVTATSLIGGSRSAGALKRAMTSQKKQKPKVTPMTSASGGEMPKRLI